LTTRKLALAIVLLVLVCSVTAGVSGAQRGLVYVAEVEGTIDAGVSNFLGKALDRAERDGAPLIIKLNTSGGLLSATKEIVDRMMTSEVVVVVWVTPRGAWCFSAGTFILMASNVAAMDSATAIGAAQPRPEDPKTTAAMAEWMESIARERGRPEDLARLFVTESKTMGPDEAYESGMVQLRASGLEQILDFIGMTGASAEHIEMGIFEEILRVLSNPDIISILFILGFLGLLFEVVTPGIGVPGVAGLICLLIALWGMGVLQINYAGIALILLGVALIAAEIFTPGFGVFGIGGGLALILGLMMVGVHREPWIEVSGDLIKGTAIALLIGLAVFFLLVKRTVRRPPSVGREELIGQTGVAVTGIDPKGLVKLRGELWTATSKEPIEEGAQVVVKDVKGVALVVRKLKRRK
jgi:membrane-bound serine protease (ClpP class)